MITIRLNHFDNEGNIVDVSTMQLTEDQVSDIIDHAAQLVIERNAGDRHMAITFDELEEALVVADVI